MALCVGTAADVLDRLWSVILSRRHADPAISHSARLLSRGIAKVAQYIVTGIANHLHGQQLPANFWYLVGAEVGLNLFFGVIARAIDYSDSLIANRVAGAR